MILADYLKRAFEVLHELTVYDFRSKINDMIG